MGILLVTHKFSAHHEIPSMLIFPIVDITFRKTSSSVTENYLSMVSMSDSSYYYLFFGKDVKNVLFLFGSDTKKSLVCVGERSA